VGLASLVLFAFIRLCLIALETSDCFTGVGFATDGGLGAGGVSLIFAFAAV